MDGLLKNMPSEAFLQKHKNFEMTGEFRPPVRGDSWHFINASSKEDIIVETSSDGSVPSHPEIGKNRWILCRKSAKPSQQWLDKYNAVLTDIRENPISGHEYFCTEDMCPQIYTGLGGARIPPRWRIERKKQCWVPWTEETVPYPLAIRKKNSKKGCFGIVGFNERGVRVVAISGSLGLPRIVQSDNLYNPIDASIHEISYTSLFENFETRDHKPCGTLQK